MAGIPNLFSPAGPIDAAETLIILDAIVIMLAIIVPTAAATLAFAWWYRASNARARRLPDFVYSGRLELVIWSIPILVVLFLGGLAWIASHDLDPARPIAPAAKPLEVEAVALDWKWLFIYPDQGVASVNRLVLPVGTPARFSITSSSVMNVFFVPQLGTMIYAMNGMDSHLELEAGRLGAFYGESAHYSGDGFSGMHFGVDAVSPAAFAAWAAGARASGPVLDPPAYEALARQSENVKPFSYRAVAAGLYQAIVTQKLAPGPGPSTETPSPQAHPRTPT